MMRFVDHHDVGKLRDAPKPFRKIPLAAKVGVAKYSEIAEVRAAANAADMGQPFTQMRLPYAFLGCFRCEEHDALTLVQDQSLNQH